MMNLNLTMNNIEYNNLQRLTFELLGRAPHLSDNQLIYVKNRIEDLLILIRNEEINPYPFYYNPTNNVQRNYLQNEEDPPQQPTQQEVVSQPIQRELSYIEFLGELLQDPPQQSRPPEPPEPLQQSRPPEPPEPLQQSRPPEPPEPPEPNFDSMTFDETLFDEVSSFESLFEDSYLPNQHNLPLQHSIHHIIKNISNDEMKEPTPDICSICHETHLISDIFTMECCNQHIGKDCLTQWIQTKYMPTCPCCRKTITSYITYCSPCSSSYNYSVLKIDCAENNNDDQWFIDNDE